MSKKENKFLGIYNIIDKDGINQSIKNVIDSNVDFNTYTTPKGLKELRIEISKYINHVFHYEVNYKDMIITNGSQQSINLIAYSFLKEGDTVLIEQPTYFGALDIFNNRAVNLVGINLHEDGLDLKMLEKKIIYYSPKLIYVTPTFNNPTGYAWTNQNRNKFLEIINRYNVMVIEDDPYSLINFTDNQYESLYQLNKGKNIIYLGTFSKLISPSINIGYLLANSLITDMLYPFKKSFDLCTSAFLQYVILDYLKNNDLKEIIHKKIKIYKELLSISTTNFIEQYKDEIEYITHPKGGIFFFSKLSDKSNYQLHDDGQNYYINQNFSNRIRINICNELDKIP